MTFSKHFNDLSKRSCYDLTASFPYGRCIGHIKCQWTKCFLTSRFRVDTIRRSLKDLRLFLRTNEFNWSSIHNIVLLQASRNKLVTIHSRVRHLLHFLQKPYFFVLTDHKLLTYTFTQLAFKVATSIEAPRLHFSIQNWLLFYSLITQWSSRHILPCWSNWNPCTHQRRRAI